MCGICVVFFGGGVVGVCFLGECVFVLLGRCYFVVMLMLRNDSLVVGIGWKLISFCEF